ncbi:hypothetical protein LB507_008911 [Fusarium sp. FIESC RH6]|nr:hypothetical protein LB507_008911 [Fusarium sp. FIESC RH6]
MGGMAGSNISCWGRKELYTVLAMQSVRYLPYNLAATIITLSVIILMPILLLSLWVNGETLYIVATAALGMGIDVVGIVYVIYLEAPFSIIDYT